MKHILIVAYGFPPANNMSAHRNFMRAKALDELGYQVTVVTRPWKELQTGPEAGDCSPRGISVEPLFGRSRVYRVPFGVSAPDALRLPQRLLCRSKGKITRNLAYFLCPLEYATRLSVDIPTLVEQIGQPPDIVLASADPWSNFELGSRLARHFSAKYVAEYRDAWGYLDERLKVVGFNTYNDNFFSQLKRRRSMRLERRLNHRADLIISVSQPIVENALKITGVKRGLALPNGFDPEEMAAAPRERYGQFTISYIGTLYSEQNTEVFFRALEAFIDRCAVPLDKIRVKMIGSKLSHGFEKSYERIKLCRHHAQVVELTGRIGKQASLTIQKSSALLVYFAHRGAVGVYSGKIFEYIASGTPVLYTPSDHGVASELLRETRAGVAFDTVEETAAYLEKAYQSWQKTGRVAYDPDLRQIEKYSTQRLNERLAEELEAL